MSEHDPHDPWASLAESLGATPANEPSKPAASRPPQAASKPKPPRQMPPTKPASGNWDQLASELGVAGSNDSPPPAILTSV